jgi:hypothetical protein
MFELLGEAITEVAEADLDGVPSAVLSEMVVDLQRQRARLEAAEARVVARWDAERCWEAEGARSGAAWLAWKTRVPGGQAHQRVRLAREVRGFPEIEQAWLAGEIERAHVASLLGCRTPRTEAAFERGHKELLDAARTMRFNHFRKVCDYWMQHADPDGVEDKAAEDDAATEVHLSQSFEGLWFGKMTFDPISGTIVNETLRILEQELFEVDWQEAKERLGREPMIFELRRTPAQRRGAAMVEMATRARTAPADGQRPRPLFTVVVGYETFAGRVCELWNGTVVTPGSLVQWLTEADIERVVFDGPSRVIDVGAKRRLFRGGVRRAVEVRDRTCFHPTCDEPPACGQIDHIVEASKGGLTTQENGRLACGFHNRLRNGRPDDGSDDGLCPVACR